MLFTYIYQIIIKANEYISIFKITFQSNAESQYECACVQKF